VVTSIQKIEISGRLPKLNKAIRAHKPISIVSGSIPLFPCEKGDFPGYVRGKCKNMKAWIWWTATEGLHLAGKIQVLDWKSALLSFSLSVMLLRFLPGFTSASSLGPVVRKLVNANLGIKFNQGPCFSYFKRVFTANSKWPFESNQSQNVGQKRFTGICTIWL